VLPCLRKNAFLKVFRNGDGLGVCGDRFQGHGCNLLKNHGGVRGGPRASFPAKRPMTCHEHTWRVERLLVLKSATIGVARIHFVAGSNFLWRKRLRQRNRSVKIIGVGRSQTGNLLLRLRPCGGMAGMRMSNTAIPGMHDKG